MPRPDRLVRRWILVTDLSQQLKSQRDFLKWMGRKYKELNPEQSAAFVKGAELFETIRQEILAGEFDVDEPAALEENLQTSSQVKELFTNPLQDLLDRAVDEQLPTAPTFPGRIGE